MNFKIREVKLKSGKVAVQVYTIVSRKRNILKHLGIATAKQIRNILKY